MKAIDPKPRLVMFCTAIVYAFVISYSDANQRRTFQNDTHIGTPRYMILRPGLQLYLYRPDPQSIMAPEFPEDREAVLLANFETVQSWSSGRSRSLSVLPHYDVPSGTIVSVNTWKYVHKVTNDNVNMIKVTTMLPPIVTGWIEDKWLIPIIPRGSQLLVNDYMFFTPFFNREKPNKGTRVALFTRATLISEAPNTQSGPFYVQINAGPLRGKRGYFNQLEVYAESSPLKSDRYINRCHCLVTWPVAN